MTRAEAIDKINMKYTPEIMVNAGSSVLMQNSPVRDAVLSSMQQVVKDIYFVNTPEGASYLNILNNELPAMQVRKYVEKMITASKKYTSNGGMDVGTVQITDDNLLYRLVAFNMYGDGEYKYVRVYENGDIQEVGVTNQQGLGS
jgi:predicted RND superfamily exporter protein